MVGHLYPGGQSKQEPEFATEEYVPNLHSYGVIEGSVQLNPDGHAKHTPPPLTEYVPELQGKEDVEVEVQYLPASQVVQVVAPSREYSDGSDELQAIGASVVVGHLKPAEHFVQTLSPARA